MLQSFVVGEIFGYLLVFARIGAGLMMLPGIGEAYVTPRIRLMLALLITLIVLPAVASDLPALPDSPIALALLLVGEIIIGIFLGMLSRLMLVAFDIAGMIISFHLSLANAFVFNPAAASQGSIVGAFLLITAMLLIFITDLHHLMILTVIDSYGLFQVGVMPPIDDMAHTITRFLADSFELALRIAAPFVIVGLVLNLGMGLISRLMPQIMIFFVAMPVQILLGMTVLALTVSAAMMFWLAQAQDRLIGFLSPI